MHCLCTRTTSLFKREAMAGYEGRLCVLCCAGMTEELWIDLHGEELAAAGHTAAELFGKHDENDDERLGRDEYEAALKSFRGEL